MPFALVVQGGRLLVHRHGAGIVAERLEREPHRVDGFEVGRIQLQRLVERLARLLPLVLDRKQRAQVVVDLRGLRLVLQALLELHLRGVEAADDHQVAPENLVRLGVRHVELQRLRERADRCADLLLGELAVPERVPGPRRRWARLHVLLEQRLGLGEFALTDVALEHRDTGGIVHRRIARRRSLRRLGGRCRGGATGPACAAAGAGGAVADGEGGEVGAVVDDGGAGPATAPDDDGLELAGGSAAVAGARASSRALATASAGFASSALPYAATASATFPCFSSTLPSSRWASAESGRACTARRSRAAACSSSPFSSAARPSAMSRLAF